MQGTPSAFITNVTGSAFSVSLATGNVESCLVSGLSPSSVYSVTVSLIVYGGGNIGSPAVSFTTPDGGRYCR